MSDENKTLTPVWIAYVDGKRLNTDYEGALKSIRINDGLNRIGKASMIFDLTAVDFEDETFSLMSEVSIHLGYKDDVESVFSGVVTGFAPRFEQYHSPTMEVIICTPLFQLKNGTHTRSFTKKNPAKIIREILDVYALDSDIEDFGPEWEYIEQKDKTDWDYITSLTSMYAKNIYYHENKVIIKSEIAATSDDVILEWGKSLISAETNAKSEGRLSQVMCFGHDWLSDSDFSATAKVKDLSLKIGGKSTWENVSKGFDANKTHAMIGGVDENDAKEIASAYLLRDSFNFQSCRAQCEGNYKIIPGNRLSVKYIGPDFSGEYLVDSVRHEFSILSGYTSECFLKRNCCETSNSTSNVSAIDKEMAASQVARQNEEMNQGSSSNNQVAQDQNDDAKENSEETEVEKSISNPHWEDASGNTITKALVGDEVYLCAEVNGIAEQKSVKLKIVEKDSDGNDDDVTTLPSSVKNSKIRRKWTVAYTPDDDDENSQQEKEEKGYTLPEYAFTVECDGLDSEESGQLDVMGWIKTQFKDKRTGEVIANRDYIIYLLDGSTITGTTTSDGYVVQSELKMGKYFIDFEDQK